ncbi:TSUP family transporter [Marinobacterium rhizophilum]|uniref:TSUP family transporter n=1 Tax=Marinobacterium rhizophilum TaxID=420402 RepID=UPI00036D5747|nr:TSUP family transporter [Marinobacterium rhizophilum]
MDLVLSPGLLAALFGVALLAGFIDTIAGGGGLLTLPALLLAQVPPVSALATNKLQSSFGSLTAALTMLRRGIVKVDDIRGLVFSSLVGSVFGTVLVQFVDPGILVLLIPLILVLIALYFTLVPTAGLEETTARMSRRKYCFTLAPLIGFYDGFLGPGTGSFFAFSKIWFRGRNLLGATGAAKVMNCASNIASLVVFVAGGKVIWSLGAAMIGGQILGALIGSHTMIRHGSRIIRPLVVGMCLLMAASYLWKNLV